MEIGTLCQKNKMMISCKALRIGKSICNDQVLVIKTQWTDKEKLILEHNRPW